MSVLAGDRLLLPRLWFPTSDPRLFEQPHLGRDSLQLSVGASFAICNGTHHCPKRRKSIFRLIGQHSLLDHFCGVYGLVGGEECDSCIIAGLGC